MNIVYLVHQFYPEFQTGTEKIVFNNALMEQKFGNSVKVICYSFYDDEAYDQEYEGVMYKEYLFKGIPVIAFKVLKQPDDLNIALENRAITKFAKYILSNETPDIIHAGHLMRVHEFISCAIEMNIPYIITLTDFFMLCPKVILSPNKNSLCSGPNHGDTCSLLCKETNQQFIRSRFQIASKILENSMKLITPSNFVARLFQQEFPGLKITVINHGIRNSNIKKNNRIYNQNSIITFGYIGSLAYHKGVHVLLEAMRGIESNYVRLLVYGSGEASYEKKLFEICHSDQRITFLGAYSAEQLGEIYQLVDVMIAPSICYESYSLSVHEALASDVPVIASDLGGMTEKITDRVNSMLVKPGDAEDLRDKLQEIIANPTILNGMKINLQNMVIIPTIEQEGYSYWQIYNQFGRKTSF